MYLLNSRIRKRETALKKSFFALVQMVVFCKRKRFLENKLIKTALTKLGFYGN